MKITGRKVDELLRSFYKLLFISLGFSVLLSYFIFFIPLNASFKKEQENYFRNEVMIKANSDENILLGFISAAESMGSRSVIRLKLAEYHADTVSMQDLVTFTQAKYIDGASALRNLVGASRHLPDGTRIAFWGNESMYSRHGGTKPGLYLVTENDHLFALVVSGIKEKGSYIGFDACVFDADILVEAKSDLVQSFTFSYAEENINNNDDHSFNTLLMDDKFILTAAPEKQIFRKATIKATGFVSLYSLILFIFISIFSYLTFFRFVRKIINDHVSLVNKADSLLAEKELVLKEVHHRIKNNMNTITGLLAIQASTISEPLAIRALGDAGNRVRSMSLLYDKLYRSTDFKGVSIKEYLSLLTDEIIANFPNSHLVTVKKDIEDIILDAKRLQSIGVIVNELITNSMKYAFKGKVEGTIMVSASNTNGIIILSLQDDGIGMPDDVSPENPSGFGLQLVNGLARQLGGTVKFERGDGTRFVLEFRQ